MPELPELPEPEPITVRSPEGMVEVTMGAELDELRLDAGWLRNTPAHRVEAAIRKVVNRALADRRAAERASVRALTVPEARLAQIEKEHAEDLAYLVERVRRRE